MNSRLHRQLHRQLRTHTATQHSYGHIQLHRQLRAHPRPSYASHTFAHIHTISNEHNFTRTFQTNFATHTKQYFKQIFKRVWLPFSHHTHIHMAGSSLALIFCLHLHRVHSRIFDSSLSSSLLSAIILTHTYLLFTHASIMNILEFVFDSHLLSDSMSFAHLVPASLHLIPLVRMLMHITSHPSFYTHHVRSLAFLDPRTFVHMVSPIVLFLFFVLVRWHESF